MNTLTSRIRVAASGTGSVTFAAPEGHVTVPWSELHQDALKMAAGLQSRGVKTGDHVALLGPTSRPLVTAIQAVWFAGATLIVLPLPMRLGSLEEFVDQTRERVRQADVDLLVIDADLAPFYEAQPGDPSTIGFSDLVGGDHQTLSAPDEDPDRLAILQFTSGSTSEPKGVMLPDHTVCANLDAITEATSLTREHDVLVSWLPLYHDMGLVGMLTLPMATGCDLVLGAPQDFLAAPVRWMEWISRYGGTATAGPNFSWVLATRALRKHNETLDLSRLRVALNGAEPVDPETVRGFIAAGERHGFRPGGVFPAFGMAELAIAGTFPVPMAGLRTDVVDARVLEHEQYAAEVSPGAEGARELVRLGWPVPGLEIRIVDSSGQIQGDREVGELQLRGTSVTSGYYRNEQATEELFQDGWLRTGDLAYTIEGEMVMCGRIKDVIIVGGRNVFPQDVERVAGDVAEVRSGNVIAFGIEGRHGKQSLVVVAESRANDLDTVRRTLAKRVREAVGLPAKDIVLVPPGSLPKTSSGKLQRSLCRTRYLAGDLALSPAPVEVD